MATRNKYDVDETLESPFNIKHFSIHCKPFDKRSRKETRAKCQFLP